MCILLSCLCYFLTLCVVDLKTYLFSRPLYIRPLACQSQKYVCIQSILNLLSIESLPKSLRFSGLNTFIVSLQINKIIKTVRQNKKKFQCVQIFLLVGHSVVLDTLK